MDEALLGTGDRTRSRRRGRTGTTQELESFEFRAMTEEESGAEDGWGAVSDLDLFFTNLYRFYENKG